MASSFKKSSLSWPIETEYYCSIVSQAVIYSISRASSTREEGGNATEFDAVFRSHQGKHCKNGKSDAVTTEIIKLGI